MHSKKSVSLICLILSVDKSPWREIQDMGQNETFARVAGSDITYLRYVGQNARTPILGVLALTLKKLQHWAYLRFSNQTGLKWIANFAYWRLGDKLIQRGDSWVFPETHIRQEQNPGPPSSPAVIVTQSLEHSVLIGLKTIKALQFIVDNYSFDYIFRTNSSSFVDGPLLLKYVKNLPAGDVYGGVLGDSPKGPFASGAGILLSKSLIEKVLKEASSWRHGLIDDVALSEIIRERILTPLQFTNLSRVQFRTLAEAQDSPAEVIKNEYHFRCKTDSATGTIQIMEEIYKRKKKN